MEGDLQLKQVERRRGCSTRRSSPLRGLERRLQNHKAAKIRVKRRIQDGRPWTHASCQSENGTGFYPAGWEDGNPAFLARNKIQKELSKSLAIPEHFLYNARGINFVMRDKICPDTMLGKRWRGDDAG